MPNPEQQQNISNLQTFENEVALTRAEIEAFNRLPDNEQEEQKKLRLAKLLELQDKLEQAINEASKTGNLDEARKLKNQIEKDISELNFILSTKYEKLKKILFDPNDLFTEEDWQYLERLNGRESFAMEKSSMAIINRSRPNVSGNSIKEKEINQLQTLAWWTYAFPDFKKPSDVVIQKVIKEGEGIMASCRKSNDWRHFVEPVAWLTIIGHKPDLSEDDFKNIEEEFKSEKSGTYLIEMAAALSIIYPDYLLEISSEQNELMAKELRFHLQYRTSYEWYLFAAMAKIVADKLREIYYKIAPN